VPAATTNGPGDTNRPPERDRAGDAPEVGDTRGQTDAVERALARLPEECRQMIDLHHRRHLSFADIAPLVGRSPESVRALWARAVEALQRELGQS
jgi:RNA polymerase sigma factor (sigma-70 family)